MSALENLRVIELKAEHFMGIKVAELRPDASGSLVIVGGRNGQGKTSLLNAIECAIRGKSHHPGKPIREGEERAEINLDLGGLKIRRIFKKEGGSAIRVSNAEGFQPTNPQTLLDTLAGAISFDPLAFQRMDAKKQLEVVRALAGVDTRDIEKRHNMIYTDRAGVNAVVKSMEGEIAAMPHHAEVGDELIDAEALVAELSAAEDHNRGAADLMEKASRLTDAVEELGQNRNVALVDITSLEEQLAQRRLDVESFDGRIEQAQQGAAAAREAFEAFVPLDSDAIRKDIAAIDVTNNLVRENLARETRRVARLAKMEEAVELTGKLSALIAQKAKLIAEADLPLEGLSFSDAEGVTLDGIPFDQISGAESLRASVAIGVAMHPKLQVMLIRDGSLLDDESMALLAAVAKENDYQVFIERVGDQDEGAIVIEAGEIREIKGAE